MSTCIANLFTLLSYFFYQFFLCILFVCSKFFVGKSLHFWQWVVCVNLVAQSIIGVSLIWLQIFYFFLSWNDCNWDDLFGLSHKQESSDSLYYFILWLIVINFDVTLAVLVLFVIEILLLMILIVIKQTKLLWFTFPSGIEQSLRSFVPTLFSLQKISCSSSSFSFGNFVKNVF